MDKIGFRLYDTKNKDKALFNICSEMLKRTLNMFEWEGLPSTIPARELELLLQLRGSCIIAQHDGNLYALGGNLSGECDAYYIPRYYVVANPWLRLEKTFERGVDCVFGVNDSMWSGLTSILERYGSECVEADISLHICNIMERLSAIIRCGSDNEKAAAEALLKRIENGELASAISSDSFLMSDGIQTLPFADHERKSITQLIEYRQYLKAGLFNELGLNGNYNMKREAINSQEAQLNNDALIPLPADMLACREKFAESVNEMFGTDISVTFKGIWAQHEQEIETDIAQLENIEKEAESNESTKENSDNIGDNAGGDISSVDESRSDDTVDASE